MSLRTVTAIALIILPVLFNMSFGMLAASFDYPDVLRQPTVDVLRRFREGGSRLILTWWIFMLTAVAFAPVAVMAGIVQHRHSPTIATFAGVLGVLAGAVQFLGLARWPFVVPYLARESETADPVRAQSIDIVFQAFNRYLGVAVGEHLGYAFTGLWSIVLGAGIIGDGGVVSVLGGVGIAVGAALLLCSMEFVGANEENGWLLAGKITPVAYVVWSLWLVALGVSVLSGMLWP